MKIQEFRQQHPEYSNRSDDELSRALHAKHYSQMDYGEFATKFGVVKPEPSRIHRVATLWSPVKYGEPSPAVKRAGQAVKELVAAPARAIESMVAGSVGGLMRMAAEKGQIGPKVAENVARLGRLTGKVPGDTVNVERLIRKYGLNKSYSFYDRKLKRLADAGKKIQDFWDEQANKGWEAPNPDIVEARWRDRPVSKTVSAVSSGITSIGVVVGVTALTKSPHAGLATLASSETGSMYSRLRDEDTPVDVASKLAMMAGAWTYVTEKVPFDRLMKPGIRSFTSALKQSGWEGAQEVIEGMGHNLLEYFGYDYRRPSDIPTAVKAATDHMMDNWVDSLVGGIGAGGLAHVALHPGVRPGEPTFRGRAYRSPSGFSVEGTAADVVRFEQEELGNNLGVNDRQLKELEKHPASDIVWVTRTEREAARYGEPEDVTKFAKGSKIIADIGPDGVLILLPKSRQKEILAGAAIRLKSGEMLTGDTHVNILKDVQASGRQISNEEFDIPAGSGFVTNTGRFVSAAEGFNIAEAANQFKSTGDPDVDAQFKKARHLVAENVEFFGRSPTVEEITKKPIEEIEQAAIEAQQVAGEEGIVTAPAWSNKVDNMKTVDVIKQLNKKYSKEEIEKGYAIWKKTPKGKASIAVSPDSPLGKAVQFETFVRLLISEEPYGKSAKEVMSRLTPVPGVAGAVTAIPENVMSREIYKLKKGEEPVTAEQRKELQDHGLSLEKIARLSPREVTDTLNGITIATTADGKRVTPATLVVDQLESLPRTQPTVGERRRMDGLAKAYTEAREKISSYVLNQDIMLKFSEMLDNYNPNGPVKQFIYRPVKAANVKARDNISKVMNGFADTFNESGIDFGGMVINERSDVVPGFPITDTERIGIYLLAKNEKGRKRVESWFGEENIDNAEAVDLVIASVEASEQEMTVAATIESYVEVMSPRFFDAALEMGFKNVKQEENYFTLLTENHDEVSQAPVVEQLASFAGGKVKTPGERAVKERTGTVAKAKIDAAVIFPEMVRMMERFIEVGPVAAKVGRSMDNPKFKIALNNATRGQGYKVMRRWLEDSTRGSVERETGYWSRWIKNRRRNAVPYLLGYKVATVMPKQFISTTNTIAKRPILAPAIMKRLAMYGDIGLVGNLKQDYARVTELSSMMKNRDWHRDLTRLYDKKDISKFFQGKRLSPLSMAPIAYADKATTTACWLSAFEQAMIDLNGNQKVAVQYADDLITEGHPMGNVEDLAGFFRGGALEKLVTTFMNQPNKNWNFLRHDIYNKLVTGKISKREAIQRFTVGQVLPALILGTITRGRLPESAEEVAKDIASFMLGGLIFFGRWVYNVATGDWDPIKSAFSTVPFKALEEAGRAVSAAKRGDVQKTIERGVGAVGAYTGKIPQQLITTTGGVIDLVQGETKDYKRLIYTEYMTKKSAPKEERAAGIPTRRAPSKRKPAVRRPG